MAVPAFSPPDVDFTRPFWDGVAADEIRLPRCAQCGAWQWYPLPGADHCPGAPLEWVAVAPTGSIFSFTVVRRAFLPGAPRDEVPITVVLVELDDAPGVRLVSRLRDGDEPRIGGSVRAEFFDREDGRRDVEFAAAG